jgi:protease II
MNTPPDIEYGTPDNMQWVDGMILLYIRCCNERFRCHLSKEVIEDHYEVPLNQNIEEEIDDAVADEADKYLEIARQHFDELKDLLLRKIQTRQFEKDGSILLRSTDF